MGLLHRLVLIMIVHPFPKSLLLIPLMIDTSEDQNVQYQKGASNGHGHAKDGAILVLK